MDPILNIHTQLRRQISDWDHDGLFASAAERLKEALPLVSRLRRGDTLTVAECAEVCRALAWDVESFYEALGVDVGDYDKLIELNGRVYFNLRAPDWDT
jgi:hypothetical protein